MKLKTTFAGIAAGASMMALAFAPVMAVSAALNGSFESGTNPGVFTNLSPGSTAIDNWTIVSGNVDYIGSYWTASDGVRSVDLSGGVAGSISQDIPTTVGKTYMVSFDLSGNPAGGPDVKSVDVSAGGTTQNFTFDTVAAGNTLGDMKWQPKSFNFVATGTTTTLMFTSLTNSAYGPAIDKVSVDEVIAPSPSPTVTPVPLTKDECKTGGWMTFGGMFKNQGDCVSYVATKGSNQPAGL